MRILASVVAAIACLALPVVPASADANDHAACIGILSSNLAGQAGARGDESHVIKGLTSPQPPGTAYRFFAGEHLATVPACQASVGG